MGRLPDSEIQQRLSASPWRREGEAIVRDFELESFARAMAFANLVAEEAEGANHHPDILVHGWNKVRLTLSTHSEGGLTDSDFALARRIDRLGPDERRASSK
jgi:4a-hydroxytetrahydrobiopterin dehydratase